MNLLELARRWLRPGVKAETEEDFTERDAFNQRAGEVFLAYHDNAPWAKKKLASGFLQLTPEGLAYMEDENERRAREQAAHDKMVADLKAEENAARSVPDADVQRVPPGNVPDNITDSGEGGPRAGDSGSGRLDEGQPGSSAPAG